MKSLEKIKFKIMWRKIGKVGEGKDGKDQEEKNVGKKKDD